MAGNKKKTNIRGTESRKQNWELQVAQFKKTTFVFEENHAVQQGLLKDLAVKLAEKWGLDLAKLTQSSREAFKRIGKMARESDFAGNEEIKP